MDKLTAQRLEARGFRVDERDGVIFIQGGGLPEGCCIVREGGVYNVYNADASARLAFGLCKKYGIELPKGAEPKDAWEAIKEATGKSVAEVYEGEAGHKSEKWGKHMKPRKAVVKGPSKTASFLKKYFSKNPKVKETSRKYLDVMDKVKNFAKNNPNAETGSYDAITGERVDDPKGYCVTFHQNLSLDDPYGAYDSDTYAGMCAAAVKELDSDRVYIGYYGNPEVSFSCNSFEKAMEFAVDHNQKSVYCGDTGVTIKNPYYNEKWNPIDIDD